MNQMVKEGFPERWMTSIILPTFKTEDKNNPGNYRRIMISSIFSKLIEGIMERKISKRPEENKKQARSQEGF